VNYRILNLVVIGKELQKLKPLIKNERFHSNRRYLNQERRFNRLERVEYRKEEDIPRPRDKAFLKDLRSERRKFNTKKLDNQDHLSMRMSRAIRSIVLPAIVIDSIIIKWVVKYKKSPFGNLNGLYKCEADRYCLTRHNFLVKAAAELRIVFHLLEIGTPFEGNLNFLKRILLMIKEVSYRRHETNGFVNYGFALLRSSMSKLDSTSKQI